MPKMKWHKLQKVMRITHISRGYPPSEFAADTVKDILTEVDWKGVTKKTLLLESGNKVAPVKTKVLTMEEFAPFKQRWEEKQERSKAQAIETAKNQAIEEVKQKIFFTETLIHIASQIDDFREIPDDLLELTRDFYMPRVEERYMYESFDNQCFGNQCLECGYERHLPKWVGKTHPDDHELRTVEMIYKERHGEQEDKVKF